MTVQTLHAIGELLGAVGQTGSFAVRDTVPGGNPALKVDGIGAVTLPVSAEQARALCEIAHPAHYGRGEQTLLDPSVRDTWQIPRELVTVDDQRMLTPLLDSLRDRLGLAPERTLSAELHSVLVYEKGQFFRPHQDSEKADGMIATLVVTLPSAFSGGEFVVEHQGQRVIDQGSPTELGIVAFYADCTHEVLPVTEGYRISLTYNLITSTSAPRGGDPSAADSVEALAGQLREHFTVPIPVPQWKRNGGPDHRAPERMVYLLDHQYSRLGLNWWQLKGADSVRADMLFSAADTAGLEVALALTEIQQSQAYGRFEDEGWLVGRHRRWERTGDQWELVDETWDPVDGEDEPFEDAPTGVLPADHPALIEQVDPEAGHDPTTMTWLVGTDDHTGEPERNYVDRDELCTAPKAPDLRPFALESEGFMGNEGNTVDRWYSRAAIVVSPRH
ncbi:2OG-Fe(II) oxygenase [Nocardia sp. NPDC058519]|uniref:2OG-Fe(II) oxygenase n=1 Tax=Nocardia sp. NPDC058519 TaxID=3346535 RepID=UPI0036542688